MFVSVFSGTRFPLFFWVRFFLYGFFTTAFLVRAVPEFRSTLLYVTDLDVFTKYRLE